AAAYLLAAYSEWFAAGTTFVCVVDPGVGGARPPVVLEGDGRWYVGPGNGLFELIQRAPQRRAAGTSTSSRSACRRAFTAATCSRRSQPCWRAASRRQAGHARMTRIAAQTGR